ncbi:MAG: dicarboxylate/amino acid:cation symporter [Nitrospirales bacterium]
MRVRLNLPQASLGLFIFLAILAAITLGIFQRFNSSLPCLSAIYPLSSIFVSILRIIVGPLVFLAVLAGVLQVAQLKGMGGIGLLTVTYYFSTTFVAICIGITLVTFFHPGEGINLSRLVPMGIPIGNAPEAGKFLVNILKAALVNPIKAIIDTNVLALVMHAMLFGLAINQLGKSGHMIRNFVIQLYHALQKIVMWVLWVAPIGIFVIMLRLVAETGTDLIKPLWAFVFVVVGGTFLHGLIILPLLLKVLTGSSVVDFFIKMKDALLVALTTSSSVAALPVTMKCVHQRLGVQQKVANFILPVGTTINMDGTALYEAIAAIFIAQAYGIQLDVVAMLAMIATVLFASFGAPGIPTAGMATMVMVLDAANLPIEAVAILIAIDRPLDTIRTALNIEGDAIGAMIINRFAQNPTSRIEGVYPMNYPH